MGQAESRCGQEEEGNVAEENIDYDQSREYPC